MRKKSHRSRHSVVETFLTISIFVLFILAILLPGLWENPLAGYVSLFLWIAACCIPAIINKMNGVPATNTPKERWLIFFWIICAIAVVFLLERCPTEGDAILLLFCCVAVSEWCRRKKEAAVERASFESSLKGFFKSLEIFVDDFYFLSDTLLRFSMKELERCHSMYDKTYSLPYQGDDPLHHCYQGKYGYAEFAILCMEKYLNEYCDGDDQAATIQNALKKAPHIFYIDCSSPFNL